MDYIYTEIRAVAFAAVFFIKNCKYFLGGDMEKKMEFAEELAKKLKKKAVRKYALMALAVIVIASPAFGLNIESKDSKLPDGQGNKEISQQIDDKDASNSESEDNSQSVVGEKDNKDTTSTSDKNTVSTTGKKPTSEEAAVDNSKDPTASNGGNSALKPDDEEKVTVTISIRCDTLSRDMSKLTNPAIAGYIPSNGIILNTTTYKGTTDNTVFDVLNTVCRNKGIQLESKYTPLYESYYVMGINYLYEFDGGPQSGWMYRVNGWFPNYGCSSYYLSDGDVIEWLYTCEGLGADVGAPPFNG